MAQEVGYYENNITFTEGPFVIVNPLDNGWRIEVQLVGHECPVLPDETIYPLMKKWGLLGKSHDKRLVMDVCDELNSMVRCGQIKLVDRYWKHV